MDFRPCRGAGGLRRIQRGLGRGGMPLNRGAVMDLANCLLGAKGRPAHRSAPAAAASIGSPRSGGCRFIRTGERRHMGSEGRCAGVSSPVSADCQSTGSPIAG
jgi:hypothetical protein